MNKDITLVILAAGMGSRFGGLKQMEPIGPTGQFIIDYSIYDAIKAGFNKVVFIIKEENYEAFKETIGSRIESQIKVEYCFQKIDNIPDGYELPKDRVKPLGTAHALYCAKDIINENFAIISADDFFGYDAFKKAADYLKNNNDFCVIGYKIGDTLSDKGSVKRGVCIEKNGYLTDIIESKVEKVGEKVHCEPLSGAKPYNVNLDNPVSMLMFGFTPKLFNGIESGFKLFLDNNQDNLDTCEYLLPDVLDKMIKEGKTKVKVLPTSSKWIGMTYKEDLPEVKKDLKKMHESGEYPINLWK